MIEIWILFALALCFVIILAIIFRNNYESNDRREMDEFYYKSNKTYRDSIQTESEFNRRKN